METTTMQIPGSPDYILSVQLLLQLHNLIAHGKEDSEEAESVRDATEKPWYRLSEAEQTRLRVLSANLDMLINDEAFRHVPPEQRTEKYLGDLLVQAQQNRDWDTALALLRNGPDFLSPDELAHLRGASYFYLGHYDIAYLFAEYAFKQNPNKTEYAYLAMASLLEGRHYQEASLWANRILANANANASDRLGAVWALFKEAQDLSQGMARVQYNRIAPILQELVDRRNDTSLDEIKQILGLKLDIILAFCYMGANQTNKAISILDNILAKDPKNEDALEGKRISTSNQSVAIKEQQVRKRLDNLVPNTKQFAHAA